MQHVEAGLFLLVYGDCEAAPGNSEPSCVAPLQIQVRPPGAIPGIARVDPVPFRGVERTVGELAGPPDPDWSSVLWLPGSATVKLYVSLDPQGEIMEAALQQLHTANHAVLGRPAIGPGEALDTLP